MHNYDKKGSPGWELNGFEASGEVDVVSGGVNQKNLMLSAARVKLVIYMEACLLYSAAIILFCFSPSFKYAKYFRFCFPTPVTFTFYCVISCAFERCHHSHDLIIC